MRKTITAGLLAAAAVGLVSGCGSGSPKPAGPPSAASLATKLGCHVTGSDSDPQTAYDTKQYVDASGSSCSDSGVVIITFPSQAKESDWLHQNQIAEAQTFGDGFYEMVVGHLWAAGDIDGAASAVDTHIVHSLGGKDTTFG